MKHLVVPQALGVLPTALLCAVLPLSARAQTAPETKPQGPVVEENGGDGDVAPEAQPATDPEPAPEPQAAPEPQPTKEQSSLPPAGGVAASAPAAAPAANPKPEPGPPKTQSPPSKPVIDYDALPLGSHQTRIDVGVGAAATWYRDENFDLFAAHNAKPSFRTHVAVTAFASGPLSVAAVGSYELFSSSGSARSLPTSLGTDQIELGVEARYHFLPRAAGYARFEGGLSIYQSHIGNPSDGPALEFSSTGFSGSLALGGAFRVAGSRDGRERTPRLHLFLETGYTFSSRLELTYEIKDDSVLRPEPVELGHLSLSGPRLLGGAMVSF